MPVRYEPVVNIRYIFLFYGKQTKNKLRHTLDLKISTKVAAIRYDHAGWWASPTFTNELKVECTFPVWESNWNLNWTANYGDMQIRVMFQDCREGRRPWHIKTYGRPYVCVQSVYLFRSRIWGEFELFFLG